MYCVHNYSMHDVSLPKSLFRNNLENARASHGHGWCVLWCNLLWLMTSTRNERPSQKKMRWLSVAVTKSLLKLLRLKFTLVAWKVVSRSIMLLVCVVGGFYAPSRPIFHGMMHCFHVAMSLHFKTSEWNICFHFLTEQIKSSTLLLVCSSTVRVGHRDHG